MLLQLLLNHQRVHPGRSAAFLAPLRGPKMWADIGSAALQQGVLLLAVLRLAWIMFAEQTDGKDRYTSSLSCTPSTSASTH